MSSTWQQPRIIVTVDVALFTLQHGVLQVVLARRSADPFKGALALPGGYVDVANDATAEDSAQRVLKRKSGIAAPYLEQLCTVSGAERDPRGWSASIAYLGLVSSGDMDCAETGVDSIELVDAAKVGGLAFDHNRLVCAAVERLRSKSSYSTLPLFLLDEEFTLGEAQRAYEIALNRSLQTANFRRWLKSLQVLEEVPGAMRTGPHRSAQLYRLAPGARGQLKLLDRQLQPTTV